jgi:hypothetical protein
MEGGQAWMAWSALALALAKWKNESPAHVFPGAPGDALVSRWESKSVVVEPSVEPKSSFRSNRSIVVVVVVALVVVVVVAAVSEVVASSHRRRSVSALGGHRGRGRGWSHPQGTLRLRRGALHAATRHVAAAAGRIACRDGSSADTTSWAARPL